ncbi:MAG TPA: hypothetical protein VGM26_03475, partial [Rhizomicrobium sp.]
DSDYTFPVAISTAELHGANNWIGVGIGRLSFGVIQGHHYKIAVGDFNGLTGIIKLRLQLSIAGPPSNFGKKALGGPLRTAN